MGRDDEYLRFDQPTSLVDSVSHGAFLANYIAEDETKWKWLIFAIHNATHSALVCSLLGAHTDQWPILKAPKRYLARRQSETPALTDRDLYMADFLTLFDRAKDKEYLPQPSMLPPNEKRDSDIKSLHKEIRNQFEHFNVAGLSLEKAGLPRIILNACDVIEHLCLNNRSMNFRLSSEQESGISNSLMLIGRHIRT